MTKIILVRHCEAQGNTDSVFQGHSDCDISGNGEKQLDLLAVRCRNMEIDAIYSSPLLRAKKTAEAVNRYHGLEIHIDNRLMEINGGDYEGVSWDELPHRYPEQHRNWYCSPSEFAAPNGESMREVYDRVWSGLTDIVRANPGKTVCVASHGCAIRNLLCRALGKPVEQMNDVDWCDNTAISVIEFDGALQPHVVRMNDASHLPPEASVFQNQDWWKRENMEDT